MAWALYFFVFSRFQKRRFEIFPAAVSQWLGHKTCWGSAFSHARLKHLFLEFGLVASRLPSLRHFIAVRHRFWKLILRLMRFVGNVSALFVVAVSHGF